MKPDAYMPLYGNDFFGAVEGLPPESVVAYLRAIWFYWSHEHCKGLRDDDEFLRRLCRIDKSEWKDIRESIFDNDRFFTQDANGFWHQKRASDLYVEVCDKYEAAVKRGQAGASIRWKRKKR